MGLIERNKAGDRFAINQRNIIVRDVPCNLTSGRINPACWKTKMHPPWETIKISGGRNHRHDGCALICNSRFGIRTSSHARRFRRRSACFTFRNIRILYELLRVPCFMPRCLATPLPPSSPFLPQERYRFFFFFFFVNSCFYSLFLSFGRHLSSFVFFPRDFEVCYEGYRYEDRRRRRTISHIFQSFVGQFYITNFPLRESSRMCEYIQIFSSTSHQVTWILKSQ